MSAANSGRGGVAAVDIKKVIERHRTWLLGKTGGCQADLSGADLSGADLFSANLFSANLSSANLSSANLFSANLFSADLRSADVRETCLDPTNAASGVGRGVFQRRGRYCIGYRTRKAGHIDIYRDGGYYNADWFSTSDTECHPGLYLWPTRAAAQAWSPREEVIAVRTFAEDIHQAGSKWRCRWFQVVGKA